MPENHRADCRAAAVQGVVPADSCRLVRGFEADRRGAVAVLPGVCGVRIPGRAPDDPPARDRPGRPVGL